MDNRIKHYKSNFVISFDNKRDYVESIENNFSSLVLKYISKRSNWGKISSDSYKYLLYSYKYLLCRENINTFIIRIYQNDSKDSLYCIGLREKELKS